jgi:hypothetical protein
VQERHPLAKRNLDPINHIGADANIDETGSAA